MVNAPQNSALHNAAWKVIFAFGILTGFLILLGLGDILNVVFPLSAFFVGVFLYHRYPIQYVEFTLWLWFLTPLTRRLADYFDSFTDPSPILLAPVLVTFISGLCFIENIPNSLGNGSFPFVIAFLSVCYALLVGIIQQSVQEALLAFLTWVSPVFLGCFLFLNWKLYPTYRNSITRTFLYGTLVMGLYGVWQFMTAPDWDCFWLLNSRTRSFGYPWPLGIRVWSTMNSPQVFAITMIPGLLLLLIQKNLLRFVAVVVGSLSFFLSMARAPWLGLIVGFMALVISLKESVQIKVLITALTVLLLIFPFVTMEPFADIIGERIESFSNLSSDNSLEHRSKGYGKLLNQAVVEVIGQGLGYRIDDPNIGAEDGTLMPMLFSLGWLGTIPYIIGLISLILRSFKYSDEAFVSVSRGVILAVIIQFGFNFVVVAPTGIILWVFLGIISASDAYSRTYG